MNVNEIMYDIHEELSIQFNHLYHYSQLYENCVKTDDTFRREKKNIFIDFLAWEFLVFHILFGKYYRHYIYNSYAEKRQPSLVVAMNQHIFENIFLKLINFAIVLSKYI